MSNGYYDEALSIIRNLREIANLMSMFVADRSTFERWKSANERVRRREFAPVEVRRWIEQHNGVLVVDKERYGSLSSVSTHPNPNMLPQAHGEHGTGYDRTDISASWIYSLCLNEFALSQWRSSASSPQQLLELREGHKATRSNRYAGYSRSIWVVSTSRKRGVPMVFATLRCREFLFGCHAGPARRRRSPPLRRHVFETNAPPRAQARAHRFDPTEEARVAVQPIVEPTVLRARSRSARLPAELPWPSLCLQDSATIYPPPTFTPPHHPPAAPRRRYDPAPAGTPRDQRAPPARRRTCRSAWRRFSLRRPPPGTGACWCRRGR